LHAGAQDLLVSLHGTDRLANIPFAGTVSQEGGTIYSSHPLGSPGVPATPGLAEGYADESGTFWAAATVTGIPYLANCDVSWQEG
jgi:hypothetical protein